MSTARDIIAASLWPWTTGSYAAADAVLAALAAAGLQVVPVEPTEEMARTGVEARWQSAVRDANNVREVYRAMLAAAPPALPKQGEGG